MIQETHHKIIVVQTDNHNLEAAIRKAQSEFEKLTQNEDVNAYIIVFSMTSQSYQYCDYDNDRSFWEYTFDVTYDMMLSCTPAQTLHG